MAAPATAAPEAPGAKALVGSPARRGGRGGRYPPPVLLLLLLLLLGMLLRLLPPGPVVPAVVRLRAVLGVRHPQLPRITVPSSEASPSFVAGALMLPDETRRDRERP
jgi:hypothetical protein